MTPVHKEQSPLYQGQTQKLILPTGREITVRETNGEDDGVLSKVGDAPTGDNLYNFLANIVLTDSTKGGNKPMVEDILGWPLNDIYYVMLKSRILNHGTKLEFDHKCLNTTCTKEDATPYEFDLKEVDNDLVAKDYIQPKNPSQIISKYPQGAKTEIEFKTSSGKTLKYKILTGLLQKRQLDMPMDDNNKNTLLIIRDLEVYDNEKWVKVVYFGGYSSREMAEIRAHVGKNDPVYDPEVPIKCPQCRQSYGIPLLNIPTFYFPVPQI